MGKVIKAMVPGTDIVITITRIGRQTWVTRMTSTEFEINLPTKSHSEPDAREMANAFWIDGLALREHRDNPKPQPLTYHHVERGNRIMVDGVAYTVEHVVRWSVPPYTLRHGFVRTNRAVKMRTITLVGGKEIEVRASDYMTPAPTA